MAALVVDLDHHVIENPPISSPDAIVVTGDIIQGVHLGCEGFTEELKRQYDTAYDFLAELTDRLLGGDRSRVVLIPGNHDVDWNTAHAAMVRIEGPEMPSDLQKIGLHGASLFRWCWRTRDLFRIRHRTQYEARFAPFWNFLERFYQDAELAFPLKSDSYFNFFELCRGRIVVTAFNSCFGNDCYSFHGAIPSQAIARSHLELRDTGRKYSLTIAVWHHNISGPPGRSDYMDVDVVHRLIAQGYRIGLYGHQHKAEATPHYIRLPEQETMAIVSAGSLCADASELPTGVNRQYNIIEIGDDLQQMRVHVREMAVSTLFGPSKLLALGGKSFVDMRWAPPTDSMGTPVDASRSRMRLVIMEAERAFQNHDFTEVERLLGNHRDDLEPHGRRILIEAAQWDKRWTDVIRHASPPSNLNELTILVHAHGNVNQYGDARAIIDCHGETLGLPGSNRRDLLNWLSVQEAMRQ